MKIDIPAEAIAAAINAPTGGAEGSILGDYITDPSGPDDADWSAIGGYPAGLHHSYAAHDWRWHIVERILQEGLSAMSGREVKHRPEGQTVPQASDDNAARKRSQFKCAGCQDWRWPHILTIESGKVEFYCRDCCNPNG